MNNINKFFYSLRRLFGTHDAIGNYIFAGAHFTNQFDRESYKDFFVKGGYDAEIDIVVGQMPCAIAVITKK